MIVKKEHNEYPYDGVKQRVIDYPVLLPEYKSKQNRKINPYAVY